MLDIWCFTHGGARVAGEMALAWCGYQFNGKMVWLYSRLLDRQDLNGWMPVINKW
jgi:hypothetical protein